MKDAMMGDILSDFTTNGVINLKERKPVTIWLPVDAKERYDRLQKESGLQFGKKAREALLKLIELAEARSA